MLTWSEWWWWAALWPIIGGGALWIRLGRGWRRPALRFPSIARFSRIAPGKTILLRRIVLAMRLPVLLLLSLAMARPQVGRTQRLVSTEGIDIMLVVDTSTSMEGRDLDSHRSVMKRKNRLQVVKGVVEKFIKRRPDDQIGLVVFGSQAFTQCPLTLDHGILSTFLGQVEIGVAGGRTAIGDGLGTAVKRLRRSRAKSKVIILLTDGAQTAGLLAPAQAAQVAKTFGVKIYSIGAGSTGEVPIVTDGLLGPQVQMARFQLDEDTLRRVAEVTGGRYFRAENEAALEKVYADIDGLEKTKIESKTFTEYDERFAWFVWPALGLLLLEILLLGTRLRKIP